MLVLTRKKGEAIVVGDTNIQVIRVSWDSVELKITKIDEESGIASQSQEEGDDA